MPGKTKRSKYGNVKCQFDNIKFDSKKEMQRYLILKDLEFRGEIKDLKLQPVIKLTTQDGTPITMRNETGSKRRQIKYIADFSYTRVSDGKMIVEDVKSPFTAKLLAFKYKVAFIEAIMGIEISIYY